MTPGSLITLFRLTVRALFRIILGLLPLLALLLLPWRLLSWLLPLSFSITGVSLFTGVSSAFGSLLALFPFHLGGVLVFGAGGASLLFAASLSFVLVLRRIAFRTPLLLDAPS